MAERNPIGKAFQLLRVMLDTRYPSWGIRDLARASGLTPSTVHRLLSYLEREGLVGRDCENGRYQVGLEFYRIAWLAETRFPIRTAAVPFMRELVDHCNETSLLGLYSSQRMEMIFAYVVESSHPVRYVIPLNEWVPVYTSASGLAIMAFLKPSDRAQIVRRTNLAPLTKLSTTDPDLLEEELRQIRSQGYAWSSGQRTPGAVGIAAPIFWGPGSEVIGDLLLTIPEQRFDRGRVPELTRLVSHSATQITETLGGRAPTQAELDEL